MPRESRTSPPPSALYHDRAHAGRELAERLLRHVRRESYLAAVSPGGVRIASVVSRRLGLPLRYVPVTRLHLPGHDEILAGAVSAAGDRVLDDAAVSLAAPTAAVLDSSVRHAVEVGRRRERQAGTNSSELPPDSQAILVSDGLDPQLCLRAAARTLRRRGAYHVTLAVPSAPERTLRQAESWAELIVTLSNGAAVPHTVPLYATLPPVRESSVASLLRSLP